jgi:signal transduction histidine kinase
MDAIGRLAGGLAHDFNNLLTIITSYSELALDSVESGSCTEARLQEILSAARAAALTRQLLAFSRQQPAD